MAGGIDQVQLVIDPFMPVFHLDRMALDGDPALTLQVHVVEHLLLHFLPGNRAGNFKQPVGQSAFPVVDMGMIQKFRMFFIACKGK